MQRFITSDDTERVSLQIIWHHFVATGPTERLARIDLIKAAPHLELRAGKATTWFAAPKPPLSVITRGIEPGERLPSAMVQSAPDPEIVCDKVVPPEVLLPGRLVRFTPELSFITSRDLKTRAMCKFEAITSSRDRVLALGRPTSKVQGERHPGGRPPKYDREHILIEAAAYFHNNGLPSTAEELADNLSETLGDKSPGRFVHPLAGG